jgi:hypothetical protein
MEPVGFEPTSIKVNFMSNPKGPKSFFLVFSTKEKDLILIYFYLVNVCALAITSSIPPTK